MSGYPSELEAYLTGELLALRHEREMFIAMDWHEAMWGVPCGPTLTMVHPAQFKGLKWMVDPDCPPNTVYAMPESSYWRSSVDTSATSAIDIDWAKLREEMAAGGDRPVEPYILGPNTYARWKANGWIK